MFVLLPGLRTIADVREVVRAVKLPLNVVTGWLDPDITLSQLSEASMKRVAWSQVITGMIARPSVETNCARAETWLLRMDT